MSAAIEQRNQDATCYVGNLDEKVTEELLWELMMQAGVVVNVHMPKDKVTGKYSGYGFVEYRTEDDADYAIKVLNMIKLYGKPIKVNKASQDKKSTDVGANLFIGNLDPDVDEKLLYDTFSAFGGIVQTPKILCDTDTGLSKGYGFVSYDTFEASDLAIECMNGQYLANRPIVVQYAFKKDTPGERHGSQAERILAASNPQRFKPNTYFSAGQGDAVMTMTSNMMALPPQQMIPNDLQQYQLQYQMQQYQQQQYIQAGYGQLPMPMQPPMPMMPMGPGNLPMYMMPNAMQMPGYPPMPDYYNQQGFPPNPNNPTYPYMPSQPM